VKELTIVGGGGKSDVWCQILADVMDLPIRQVRDPIKANARGAALIAAVGLGYLKFENIPQMIEVKATYQPNPENRTIYDKMFAEFQTFYKQNKGSYQRLNG
jgi:xylulokinase